MKTGQLRHRIDILKPTGAQDSWGTPDPNRLELHAEIWVDFRFLSGSESIKAGADVSIVRASARGRWRTDITASMVARHMGQLFDIEAVLPSADRKHVDLVCRLLPIADAPAPAPEPEPDPGDGGWG